VCSSDLGREIVRPVIRVRVTNPVLTPSFHDCSVCPPLQFPVPQMVIAGVVQATRPVSTHHGVMHLHGDDADVGTEERFEVVTGPLLAVTSYTETRLTFADCLLSR
jgi:hypothetical protein